jgi:hypothetical protein
VIRRTTEADKTDIIVMFRDMLRAHQTAGRDLEEVIAYMERVIARREKGAA